MAAVRRRSACNVVLVVNLLAFAFASYNIDQDVHLDTIGLLRKYGYPAEAHEVTTEDGYILTMHRVPYSPLAPLREGQRKQVVFLMHGLLAASDAWVVMGPGAGFAYILADAGYDVWMGNARGNTYSRRHVKYSPNGLFNSKFWDFEWHEIGIYDMPTSVDYVIQNTGEDKIFYIGHSMGNVVFWVMNSMKPEYNNKFRAMFALAPEAYLGHLPNLLLHVTSFTNKLDEFITDLIGYDEVLPSNKLMQMLGEKLCRDHVPTQIICENIMFQIAGYDPEELNSTMLPVIVSHTPAGASAKTLLHFAQEVVSNKFQQWDYGLSNIFHYGSLTPPKYNLSKVTVPVSIHFSVGDKLNGRKDVERVYKETINPIGMFKVPKDTFNHLDYLWGIHVKELVYDLVMKLMKHF